MTAVLTDGRNDVCQQDAIADVCLQVGDGPSLVTLLQVVVRPVCVDLTTNNVPFSLHFTAKYA